MSTKKRLWIIPFVILTAVLAAAVFFLLTRPGSDEEYGDPFSAKLTWLEDHKGEYDSFILGSSAASSYDPELLGGYLGASFYNLFAEGADMRDLRDAAYALIRDHEVKNIVLSLGFNECFRYGTGGSGAPARGLDGIIPETGVYDRAVLDTEHIGDLAAYENAHAADFTVGGSDRELPHIDECVACVSEISEMCREAGVNLIVIVNPEYIALWNSVSEDSSRRFREALAAVTDYWDFALTPVSYDSRYFYDAEHFRGAVGTMVMAEIFSDPQAYRPEGFGAYVTAENCGEHLDRLYVQDSDAARTSVESYTVDLPILMYHLAPENLASHLEVLREYGYTSVSLQELLDYVYRGSPLPEKPVLITFDDGYLNNYELGFPALREYGAKAVIFPIGVSVGKTLYKDTDFVMTPHFSFEDAREMISSGLVEIGSHTWDMHQWEPFESGDFIRSNILPFSGESEEEYTAVLLSDLAHYDRIIRQELGQEGFLALAYPGGEYNTLSEIVIHASGIPITFSTRTDRRNVLVQGLPQSLYALSRWAVDETTTPEKLLSILEGTK